MQDKARGLARFMRQIVRSPPLVRSPELQKFIDVCDYTPSVGLMPDEGVKDRVVSVISTVKSYIPWFSQTEQGTTNSEEVNKLSQQNTDLKAMIACIEQQEEIIHKSLVKCSRLSKELPSTRSSIIDMDFAAIDSAAERMSKNKFIEMKERE